MEIHVDGVSVNLKTAIGRQQALESLFKWVFALSEQTDANSKGLMELLAEKQEPRTLKPAEPKVVTVNTLQLHPSNWEHAPAEARWFAACPDGDAYWFESEPFIDAVAYEDDSGDLDTELRWRALGSERGIYAGEMPNVNRYNFHKTLTARPK